VSYWLASRTSHARRKTSATLYPSFGIGSTSSRSTSRAAAFWTRRHREQLLERRICIQVLVDRADAELE
jgi:hypothetical protein